VQCGRSAYAGNVRPVADGVYEAVIASAKVIASFAGHPGGPVADAVDLQRHRVRERPGHHLDQLVLGIRHL